MNDLPRKKLAELVAKYGRDLSVDPRRCEALLCDVCGQHKRENFILVSVAKEHAAAELEKISWVPMDIRLTQLAKRLNDNLGLPENLARWGVESWALALGIITDDETTWSFTCPVCGATGKASTALAGTSGRCPKCQSMIDVSADGRHFVVHSPAASSTTGQSPAEARPAAAGTPAICVQDIFDEEHSVTTEDMLRAALRRVLADGLVTNEEKDELQNLRRALGIGIENASRILREVQAESPEPSVSPPPHTMAPAESAKSSPASEPAHESRLKLPSPHRWSEVVAYKGELLTIPPGEYWIGDDGIPNAAPRHCRWLRGNSFIDAKPVTWGDFEAFLSGGGYRRAELWPNGAMKGVVGSIDDRYRTLLEQAEASRSLFGNGPLSLDHPLLGVTWFEAFAISSFYGARLPYEVEWEVAMLGEPSTGQTATCSNTVSLWNLFPRSARGCIKTIGWLQEWTLDVFSPRYWRADVGCSGIAWQTAAAGCPVAVRGASPDDIYRHVSYRIGQDPAIGGPCRGFRRAWDAPPSAPGSSRAAPVSSAKTG